jgi:hypothetical protein
VEIFRVSEDQEVGRKMAINVDRVVVKKPAVFKEMVCSANGSLSAHATCTPVTRWHVGRRHCIIVQGNNQHVMMRL